MNYNGNEYDRAFQRTVKESARTAGSFLKNLLRKKMVLMLKKLAMAALKTLLFIGKLLLAMIGIPGIVFVIIFIAVSIIYAVLLHPVSISRELEVAKEQGTYKGKVMSFYIDVGDEWDEQLDKETIKKYLEYKNKCIKDKERGYTEFQKNQGRQYALPYSLIMAIERMELFTWGPELQERTGFEKWKPRPDEVYNALKTYYTWEKSTVEYRAEYTYSYSYTYKWDEWIPPRYDPETGEKIRDGYWKTHIESGKEEDVEVELEFPFEVELLKEADTFENVFVHEYGDCITEEDMVTGGKSYHTSGRSYRVLFDNLEESYDGYKGQLLEDGLKEAVENDAEKRRNKIRESFHPRAYDIDFTFSFEIKEATKRHRPLKSIYPKGTQFQRLKEYLRERFGYELSPVDIETIFRIATEYDEEFAYNFAANNYGFAYFSRGLEFYYEGSVEELAWPIPEDCPHYITSYFGPRWGSFHGGIDIGSYGKHIPVIAAADGMVVYAGTNGGYGNMVLIDHGKDEKGRRISTLYAHLKSFNVRAGEEVEKGDIIGLMGNTGRSTGIHLHYEIRVDGRRLNPLMFYKNLRGESSHF